MSTFDETGNKLAEEHVKKMLRIKNPSRLSDVEWVASSETIRDHKAGRNSVKPSLEVAIRALEKYTHVSIETGTSSFSYAAQALSQIKANGDYIEVKE